MTCEKCWADAYLRSLSQPEKTQAEHYGDLLVERKDNPCTPEQERGFTEVAIESAQMCSYCKKRPVAVSGVGGPKCVECEDMLFEN